MNINDIMNRDIYDAHRHIDAEREREEMVRQTRRRERLAYLAKSAFWMIAALLALVAAFVAGYWKCGKDDLARQAEQERAWAKQDAKIAAEVRAMSNSELFAATERYAANRRNAK